jgi:hypothetical protein
MLAPDVRVSDDSELDLVGPVADEFVLSISTGAFESDAPKSSPSADPVRPAVSSAVCKLFTGIAGDPPSGRNCGSISGE